VIFTDAEGGFSLLTAPRTYSIIITAESYSDTVVESVEVKADVGIVVEIQPEE